MAYTDDELMTKIASGDRKAFSELFDRHGGKVFGYAKKLLNDEAQAEDISQEIWMKVIQLSPNYKSKGFFISWVFTMTRNLSFNVLRKQNRIQHFDETEEGEIPDIKNLEKEIIDAGDRESVLKAIDALPDLQRVALVSHLTEDLSYEEIASQMQVSVSSVKSLIFRARRNLDKSIKDSQ